MFKISLFFALVAVALFYLRQLALNCDSTGQWCSSMTAEGVAVALNASLVGETILITGAKQGGLGFSTARVLASRGAKVLVHTRSMKLSIDTVAELSRQCGPLCRFAPIAADLADLKSLSQLVLELEYSHSDISMLVLNAGIMASPADWVTKDGIELQMGVNHVAHFFIATRLLESLSIHGLKRIVVLSSSAHAMGRPSMFVESPSLTSPNLSSFELYGNSKLANIMFARELARRYTNIDAYSVHPGVILTNLGRHVSLTSFNSVAVALRFLLRMPYILAIRKAIEQGASTSVYCVVSNRNELVNGGYYSDNHLEQLTGDLARQAVASEHMTSTFFENTENLIKQKLQ